MIKLFRNIRKNLLNEGKTTKPALRVGRYFKYAVGEIVLVVIGILNALQINNWNQAKLKVKKKIKVLKAFAIQFKEDIREFDQALVFYRDAKKSIEIIK